MTLSILICTLPERAHLLKRLMDILSPQMAKCNDHVEIVIHDADRGTMTTGEKRNRLMAMARGKYTVFIDDDDVVPHHYISSILTAAKKNPDVITFRGYMTTNGKSRVDFVLRLGEKYEARMVDGREKYFRFPNHIVPMKRELIRMFSFPNKTMGEDYEWALQIHRAGVLRTEFFIDQDLYHYDFKTKKQW